MPMDPAQQQEIAPAPKLQIARNETSTLQQVTTISLNNLGVLATFQEWLEGLTMQMRVPLGYQRECPREQVVLKTSSKTQK